MILERLRVGCVDSMLNVAPDEYVNCDLILTLDPNGRTRWGRASVLDLSSGVARQIRGHGVAITYGFPSRALVALAKQAPDPERLIVVPNAPAWLSDELFTIDGPSAMIHQFDEFRAAVWRYDLLADGTHDLEFERFEINQRREG